MGGRAGACDSLRCLSACLFLTVHLHRWVHFVHSVFVGRRVRHLCETSSTHPAANNTSTSRYLVLTCHRGISQVDKDDSVSLRYNGSYLDLACHLPRPPPSPCPRRPSTECNCTHEIKKQSSSRRRWAARDEHGTGRPIWVVSLVRWDACFACRDSTTTEVNAYIAKLFGIPPHSHF
ncbi:hypothetical protein IWX49DRAFT_130186 [Phyllosticta citricarpa]|uniref:Uncharacterized protein n=1 Tax=Phyllosticta citricarpa TaxID=55181 RepID=A0ABR1ML49_9PEZI